MAVKDFSFTLPSRQTTVFVGSSKCGKTTLLRMINRSGANVGAYRKSTEATGVIVAAAHLVLVGASWVARPPGVNCATDPHSHGLDRAPECVFSPPLTAMRRESV